MSSKSVTGAYIIARTLRDLGVSVVFGLVGVPVSDIAEQAINLGIRFIGFRNEQAASYAATAYGYLTGKPGVCLVVGGPGVLHAIAGVGNASANNFPFPLLGGSIETNLVTKGAFQELDSVSLLTPHTKLSIRPPNAASLPSVIANAYRCSFYGRPGTSFIDLPADIIMDPLDSLEDVEETPSVANPPAGGADEARLFKVAQLIKGAKAPLVLIGKGAAYARAEDVIRRLIDQTNLPFLPSPMGKGVLPDSHPRNVSSARSVALKMADVVLILGARLNWIFHYGEPPKWNPAARFIQVDISPEELGRNAGDAQLALVGDVNIMASQLTRLLADWHYDPSSSGFARRLIAAKEKNEAAASAAAADPSTPLSYAYAFDVIKKALHSLSPSEEGGTVYIAEGANTMDISRSIFPLQHPRLRLDAGSYATMGVGLPYAIAAYEAYNGPGAQATSGPARRKKVVAIEGDSAFGFAGMEIETMARFQMDILIFVINNGGIYFGDSSSGEDWSWRQERTVKGEPGLRSWALGWEVRYEKMAEVCGGLGYFVRTPEELHKATIEGFQAEVPVIVNVIIQSGKLEKASFGWQVSPTKKTKTARL
ncbi:2-hydroxyphytanoyl-CoA lyase [Lindgomyces ingoldianus]|uniref:2-hydroxyphytanoyl-CoA lyase n=1 Tax=Lindgomyces ingoldianus TaxID=673940 RepID=A0ACB6QKR1_9PLEO|nr:2-hydroxyphytanoyl-CoA lyase [Lindgomyces ingoldianus]KAF2467506.1 2-hydroxyphytanoyl-CoA lyase [Lindgomyces ingoldianus]